MKNVLSILTFVFLATGIFAQTQYGSFNYKSYKMGFKAPIDFKINKNTTTEFAISSTERGLTFRLRPLKEDASLDLSSAVEAAKIGMVEVNATYSNVSITESADVLLSSGLSGYYMAGTGVDGVAKINFYVMGIYNSSGTMQFYGISSYPVDRRTTSNYDVSKRILQSMQVIP